MADAKPYRSLSELLLREPPTVALSLDDGWGERFPFQGREIDGAVLFADLAGFAARTESLNPAETLLFINQFMAWITGESLRHHRGVVDKYMGDAVMVVFSKEFGSEDPFGDALATAMDIGKNDPLAYCPHIGVASGRMIVGVTGTAIAQEVSVFGAPVALAARCAAAAQPNSIAFPASAWEGRDLHDIIALTVQNREEAPQSAPSPWVLGDAEEVKLKNLSALAIRKLTRTGMWLPCGFNAESRVRDIYRRLWDGGHVKGGTPPTGA